MTGLGLMSLMPVLMWAVQSLALVVSGAPIRWRIDSRKAPPLVRTAGRVATPLALGGVILAYPPMIGEPLLPYYARLLPGGPSVAEFGQGFAASVLCLSLLYLAWVGSGRAQVLLHQSRGKWVKRVVLLVPTALFGALVEELLFRGVLVADLMRGVRLPSAVVLWIGAMVFAGAHYVRSVKRRWTFPGHLLLGALLCMAFIRTGNLWLAGGLHAGGIFMIMGARPFLRYRGPAWLTGASIFPFAGVVGVAGLSILTGFVAKRF